MDNMNGCTPATHLALGPWCQGAAPMPETLTGACSKPARPLESLADARRGAERKGYKMMWPKDHTPLDDATSWLMTA
eukprot:CAMPEP_0197925676 /NCGR_PEP_ID=MMETSP1439-20131203/97871_1 /TAXON_ID=66791 /ORGANISM="Gonyaulax spinifera, Strain CCMP409" /LENGTH=76 /DNA_ID=CAMNT_0043548163 /DNA_START=8 /DNA_END=236 /DNA_ORIENTATION=-